MRVASLGVVGWELNPGGVWMAALEFELDGGADHEAAAEEQIHGCLDSGDQSGTPLPFENGNLRHGLNDHLSHHPLLALLLPRHLTFAFSSNQ